MTGHHHAMDYCHYGLHRLPFYSLTVSLLPPVLFPPQKKENKKSNPRQAPSFETVSDQRPKGKNTCPLLLPFPSLCLSSLPVDLIFPSFPSPLYFFFCVSLFVGENYASGLDTTNKVNNNNKAARGYSTLTDLAMPICCRFLLLHPHSHLLSFSLFSPRHQEIIFMLMSTVYAVMPGGRNTRARKGGCRETNKQTNKHNLKKVYTISLHIQAHTKHAHRTYYGQTHTQCPLSLSSSSTSLPLSLLSSLS